MEEKQKFPHHRSSGKVLVASLFILSGALLFARNMGWITYELFDIVVSWQSLLIILGVYSMTHRHYIGGTVLILVGAYFLVGGLSWLPSNALAIGADISRHSLSYKEPPQGALDQPAHGGTHERKYAGAHAERTQLLLRRYRN